MTRIESTSIKQRRLGRAVEVHDQALAAACAKSQGREEAG